MVRRKEPLSALTEEQVKMVLTATKDSPRDWEIFSYFVATGKRASEVAETFGIRQTTIGKKFSYYSRKLRFR